MIDREHPWGTKPEPRKKSEKPKFNFKEKWNGLVSYVPKPHLRMPRFNVHKEILSDLALFTTGTLSGVLVTALFGYYSIRDDLMSLEKVQEIVNVTRDSVEVRAYNEAHDALIEQHDGAVRAYSAQIDSLNLEITKRNTALNQMRRQLAGVTKRTSVQNNSLWNAQLAQEKAKLHRLEAAVTPFLLGSPDSARVMDLILSDKAAIYTGKAAQVYDPRAEEGEVYVFQTNKNGEPVGFGYRLGRK